MNPGTMIGGEPTSTGTDIGNRRLRFLALKYQKIHDCDTLWYQQSSPMEEPGSSGTGGYGAGKKPGIFFHDAWNEYALVLPEKTKIQFDSGWRIALLHGLSRATMASTLNFLTIDALFLTGR
jgi:hypothetical protein